MHFGYLYFFVPCIGVMNVCNVVRIFRCRRHVVDKTERDRSINMSLTIKGFPVESNGMKCRSAIYPVYRSFMYCGGASTLLNSCMYVDMTVRSVVMAALWIDALCSARAMGPDGLGFHVHTPPRNNLPLGLHRFFVFPVVGHYGMPSRNRQSCVSDVFF